MMTALPADLTQWAFGFMLVLARVGAAMTVLPALGEAAAPTLLRIGLALALTILLLPGLESVVPPVPEASLTAGGMVAADVVTGLWFGWLARMVALALPIAAEFIAFMLGLSSVLQPDTDLGPQTTALASLSNIAAPLILLVTGLYMLPLEALAGLYRLVPPGGLLPVASGTEAIVRAVTEVFSLAMRLASPFVVASIVWHVTIGLIARLLPRMQIYFVAMPGQILGGLLLLAGLSGTILAAWQDAVRAVFATLPGAS
jgi:flagellar biosynthesis protein FliR